jgi:monothiol glutaredoxin
MDDQTRSAIESLLRDNRVVLFMKGNRAQPQCGFSAKTTAALDMLLPEYVTINVLEYPAVREGIKEYSNWPTIPQLYVDGELIGGSDIIQEMMATGELADVLGLDKPAAPAPNITISEDAAAAIRNALQSQPNMALNLQIDAGWSHALSLAPAKPDAIIARSGDIELQLDAWSAERAEGLRIGMEKQLAGTRFVFDNPNAPPPVQQMNVQTLKQKLDSGETVLLFDVRGDDERARVVLEFARPWDEEAMAFIDKLPRDTEIVFHCAMGGRSQQAAEHYRRLGFRNLHNLEGGIQAWAKEIDPSLPID